MSGELPRVTLSEASARPKLDYVLPGLLAGSVGLIVGQGAVGKSFLALQIGLAVATGQPVAGGLWSPGGSGPVTLVFGEDQTKLLLERLYWLRQQEGIDDDEAARIDENIDIRSGYGEDMRVVAKTRDGLADGPFYKTLLQLARGRRVLGVDPLAFLSDGDENDNGSMTRLMQTLQRIARETGCTIILLHHVSKGGEGDREEWTAARGASSLTTTCRWQVNLRPPAKTEQQELGIGDDERGLWVRVAVVKSNYGETPPAGWLQRTRGGILNFKRFGATVKAVKAAAQKYSAKKGGYSEFSDDDGARKAKKEIDDYADF